MKLNLARTSLGIILFAALVGLAPAAQAHNRSCSQAGVAGKWGYTYTGTIFHPTAGAIQTASVGRFTLDAEGNLSGSQSRSVGGSTGEEFIKGSGTVNEDCTASYKVDVLDAAGNLLRTAVLNGVYVDDAAELRAIFMSLVLPNGASLPTVITVDAKKLHSEEQD